MSAAADADDTLTRLALFSQIENPLRRRVLPDGRIAELHLQVYNFRITVTLPENDGMTYDDMWCYKQSRRLEVLKAFEEWNGEDEPPGWNKHPPSGRWREDGTPESEINQRDAQ